MRSVLPLALVVVLLLPGSARAEPEPWKQGVTPERQQAAQQLLEDGNAQFLERNYVAALASYEAAIAVWDHPAIRFNMVRALVQLGKLVEASENLDLALQYGPGPLEENVYREALSYQKSLADQIAALVVTCMQEGVLVTLDGKPLLTCPGKRARRVLPGHHQLVGRKSGYLTRTVELVAHGGKQDEVSLSLQQVGDAPSSVWTKRRVIAVGLGVVAVASLGTGIGVGVVAENRQSEAYALCPDPDVPCAHAARADELVRDGHRLATGANLMFGLAAIAALGGATLWWLGAPVTRDGLALTPSHNGIAVSGRF